MQDLEFVYEKLKDNFDLELTNTFALNEGYTIDVPVIIGKSSNKKFYLYKEDDLFVFTTKLSDNSGNHECSHTHPYDVNDSINCIKKFML